MRYPNSIRAGGRIGFIAPSFGCTFEPYISAFESAQRYFREAGFDTLTGENCFKAEGFGKSAPPEACGREINEFFTSPDVDAVISCGGGETMCEDLEYVDLERISRARPRWFMGYSDNTNLTFTLPTLCDTAAVYGPNAPAFGMRPLHRSLEDALGVLKGSIRTVYGYPLWEKTSLKTAEDPLAPYNVTEPSRTRLYSSREAAPNQNVTFSGRLIGGCLDCLVNLAGTRFDKAGAFSERYKSDGLIWFLEACDLTPAGVRRALWQLDNAGWFRHVSGFILGRPMHIDEEPFGMTFEEAAAGILAKYRVPVVLDADIGHLPPSMPVVSGAPARITLKGSVLRIDHLF